MSLEESHLTLCGLLYPGVIKRRHAITPTFLWEAIYFQGTQFFCISNTDIENNDEEKLSKSNKFKTKNSLLAQQVLNFRHSFFLKYNLIRGSKSGSQRENVFVLLLPNSAL